MQAQAPVNAPVQVVLDAHTQPYYGTRPIPNAIQTLADTITTNLGTNPARIDPVGSSSRGWIFRLSPTARANFARKGYFLARSVFWQYWMDDRLFTGWVWHNLATSILPLGRPTSHLPHLSRTGTLIRVPAIQRPGDPVRPTGWRRGNIMPDQTAPVVVRPPPPGAVANVANVAAPPPPPPPPPPQQPSAVVVLPLPAAQTNVAAAAIQPQPAAAPQPVIAPTPAAAPQPSAVASAAGTTASASNVANTDNNDEQNDNDDEEEAEAESAGGQESNNQSTNPVDANSLKASSSGQAEDDQTTSPMDTGSPTHGSDAQAEGEQSDANKQPTSPMDTNSSNSDNDDQAQNAQPTGIGQPTHRSDTDTGNDKPGVTKTTRSTADNDPPSPAVVMIDIHQAAQAGPSGVPRTRKELDALDGMVNPSFYQGKYERDNPGARETVLERTKAALAEGTGVSQSSNTGSGGQAGGAREEEEAD